MIYVDTSALAKLVVDEAESAALSAWLDERADEILATSIVTRVELVRAATRHSAQARLAALALLGELALIPLDPVVADIAWALEPATLRSLDALHVASATTLSGDTVMVAYDERLLAAARNAGLACESPR